MSQYTPTTEIIRSHFSASADEYGTRDGIALTMEEAETAFDNWHQEQLRKAKEQAWDEGHEDGAWNTHNTLAIERLIKTRITNPYRSQQ